MASITASGTGTMSIYVGSELMELVGKVDLEHGGISRKPQVGPGGVIPGKWVETYIVPTLSIEVADGANVNAGALKDVTNVPIQIAMRNGKTFLMTNASCDGHVSGDLIAGHFTLKYFGAELQEITV